MMKLTKYLVVIKERNFIASFVLDNHTNRRNATKFLLTLRFTIYRKILYHPLSGIYNATKIQRTGDVVRYIVEKYKSLLINLNKGGILTYYIVK